MRFPDRKRNRMFGYDYSLPGFYHVVINVKDNKRVFGKVRDYMMVLNKYGKIVEEKSLWLERYENIRLDEFCIMPNHVHGIVEIIKTEGTTLGLSVRNCNQNSSNLKIKSLSNLIGAFKMQSSKYIHLAGFESFRWHRSFWDSVIRSDKQLEATRAYIRNNPRNWEMDRNYPEPSSG